MAELGNFSNFYYWYLGKLIKNLKIDIIFTFGKESKKITEVSRKGIHFYEIDELKKKLKKEIRKQDAILIKGSRIMKMEEIVEFLKENFV